MEPAPLRWVVMAILAGGAGVAHAATLGVGTYQPYATIGEAMVAAGDGDTIEIQPGVYVEDLVVTKALTFVGVGGAGQVTLQSAGGLAVVDLRADTSFLGLTVEPAGADGFIATDAAVTRTELVDVTVTGANTGFHATFGEVSLTRSTFTNNVTGALLEDLTGAAVDRCWFEDNDGGWWGAGLHVDRSGDTATVSVRRSTFVHNHSPFYGGGLYVHNSGEAPEGYIVLEDNSFFGNAADREGGGAFVTNRQSAFDPSAHVAIFDNLFVENDAKQGGGLMVDAPLGVAGPPLVARIYDNTFVANRGRTGTALYVRKLVRPQMVNDLIAFQTDGPAFHQEGHDGLHDYLLFYGNVDDLGGAVNPANLGPAVIFGLDPLFTAYSEDADFTNDDYTLLAGSPAIDAGEPRLFDDDGSISDIGARP